MKLITLSNGHIVKIDDEEYELASRHSWYGASLGTPTCKKTYAVRWRRQRPRAVYLHREIMKPPPNMIVDHINGDTLDNRKSNLRIIEPYQNSFNRLDNKNNTSGVRGVYRSKGLWRGVVGYKGKKIFIGYFADLNDAKLAVEKTRTRLHKI